MTTKLAPLALVVLSLGLLVAAWLGGEPGPLPGFPLDDAWIHMVYGRQLTRDGFLAYNPGVPATGATSPLWALCVGALHGLLGSGEPGRLVLANYALGIVLHLGALASVIRLARAMGASSLAAYAAALCLGSTPLLALSAFSGMEVGLTALLLVLGHERLLRRSWLEAGVLLGLAAWARPEAALCLIAALAWLFRAPRSSSAPLPARARLLALARFAAPPLVLGGTLVAYNLWASGKPLPATYYFKQALALDALPGRLWVALSRLLPAASPFVGGWIWLGLGGLVLAAKRARKRSGPEASSAESPSEPLVVLLGGLAFLIGNVVVIPPSDPAAYYHQRYALPAAYLLVPVLIAGFERLALGTRAWQRRLPLIASTIACLLVGLGSLSATSRRFHSDIRNINELQRALGEWLAAHAEPSSWLATVDAGAIRYFADRPTIDIMGLNTPELYWQAPSYAAARPVHAIALMPAWFPEVRGAGLKVLREVRSQPYTVTSNRAMGWQVALGCVDRGAEASSMVGLAGVRRVLLYCKGP